MDEALVSGESFRDIAGRFALSRSAVERHGRTHLPESLTAAQDAEVVANADDLLARVRDLEDRAMGILTSAEAAKDLRAATSAIREARACLELMAKLRGQLDERSVVNVLVAPQWVEVRATVVNALTPFPEALQRVMHALEEAVRVRR